MNIFENSIQKQKNIDGIVNELGVREIIHKNALIKDRIMNPSHYVVMLGETSSGKSSLINSILQEKVLAESVRPTTGVVTEVFLSTKGTQSLMKVKKDGLIEAVAEEDFNQLTINPTDDIQRLKCIGKPKDKKYEGIRIFDTPGYGSLVDYHEDVLKEFIPESDFIVYVVSYKVGLNDDDYQFLKYVGQVVGQKIDVVLAINMCPKDIDLKNNKRIKEIRKHVDNCIGKPVDTFYIESNSEKNISSEELWDYILLKVNDSKMKEQLALTLNNYQNYILNECKIKVISQIANIESEKNDINKRKEISGEFLEKQESIIMTLERGFTKVIVKSIKLIDNSAINIKQEVDRYIHDEAKWINREETYSIMQHHYIPNITSEETEKILNYIEEDVILLDRKIENIMNDIMTNIEDRVKINIPCYVDVIDGILKKHIGDVLQQATAQMFRNTDNAENGDLSRKNFKKIEIANSEDYNSGISKIVKLIRASSIKEITRYLSVLTDSFIYLYDAIKWQNKINNMSMEAIDSWAANLEKSIRVYLEGLKENNKCEIEDLFKELTQEFVYDEDENISNNDSLNYERLMELKNSIQGLIE